MTRPYLRRRTLDNSYWYMNHLATALATTADTGASLSVFEMTCRPGMEPPPHIHSREMEAIYMLDGRLTGWSGEKPLDARTGEIAQLPVHEPHAWKLTAGSDGVSARGLVIVVPGDFEAYFMRFSQPAPKLALPEMDADNRYAVKMQENIAQVIADAAEFGIQWMPPDYAPNLTGSPAVTHPCLPILGEEFTPLALAVETGGSYSALEWVSPPASVLPKHVHHNADEAFYVLEGAVNITTEEGFAVTARPGDFVFLPRGLPHTHRAAGGRPSRCFQILTPGGVEEALAEVATLAPEEITPELLMEIAERGGISLLPE